MNGGLLISVYSLANKLVPLALVCSGLLVGGTAHGDRLLTLDDAVTLARQNNRDLKAARESLAQVQVVVEQTRAQLLPTIAAQGKYTFNYPSAVLDPSLFTSATSQLAGALAATSTNPAQTAALNAFQTQLAAANGTPITIVRTNQLDFTTTAAVPLLVPGAYPAYQAALATKRAAAADLAVTETTLLLGAAQGFYGCAGADELLQARRHAIEVAQQTLKNAKARLAAGVVNRVEVTRAELALVQAEQNAKQADDQRAQAYRALSTLLQLREHFTVQPGERQANDKNLDELQREALKLRPEFTALDLNIVVQDKQALSGWLRWVPTISAFGRFAAGNYSGFSGQKWSVAAGLEADWQLYDGGLRDASRHQAESLRRQYELQLAQLHDTINDDIAQADRALRTKRDALTTAQKSVGLSQETLELIRAQHDAGTATQLDLLQAQDALVVAEVTRAQARFDLAMGELTLQRLAGTFPGVGATGPAR